MFGGKNGRWMEDKHEDVGVLGNFPTCSKLSPNLKYPTPLRGEWGVSKTST
jgi:hypothetical protein